MQDVTDVELCHQRITDDYNRSPEYIDYGSLQHEAKSNTGVCFHIIGKTCHLFFAPPNTCMKDIYGKATPRLILKHDTTKFIPL